MGDIEFLDPEAQRMAAESPTPADVARTRAAGIARDGVDHMAGITDEEMARALGGESVTLGGGAARMSAVGAEPPPAPHPLDALRAAIHFTTDDRDDGSASTPAEHALLALQHACETRDWDATNAAAACLCETLADESRALRLAAAAVFGDEFRRKGDLT